ncbi:MAG: hypothetical protein IPM20_05060 [Gammaproteobacteria bacterium]|nr:hypothetical protein [Gammaproteobacteria bacterium]
MTNLSRTNQGGIQRIALLIVSIALIAVTLQSSGPMGWMVMLPFLAIYFGISTFTGWDPIKAVFTALMDQGIAGRKTLAHQG